MTDETRVPAAELQEFAKGVFVAAGVPSEDAALEAEVLVWANLRGVDSHGVLRIPSYLEMIARGDMNPRPKIRVEKETAATVLIDGDRALGPVVTTVAMRRAIDKARAAGIGWAVIRNTTHQGAMAYYTLMAVDAGMAGIAIVCSPPNMAPFGARVAGVHNSPISIAVPAGRHRPLCLDMATSVAAGGKLRLAQDKRIPLPSGWALDEAGQPTTDASRAKILLPFGGPKGSGLAMMFETLTSLMVGNPLLGPAHAGEAGAGRHRQNSVVAALDIGAFTDLAAYRAQVDRLVDGIRALPAADGVAEVLVPGEPEDRMTEERQRRGIPLPVGTVENLRGVAARLRVPLPAGL
ncbi:MAG TPA: Ldh family oxidoreductase [Methylomirabilota bacterium]|jgi:LDH2 family malate/lactate/ureidoglycolate dehydrogenase